MAVHQKTKLCFLYISRARAAPFWHLDGMQLADPAALVDTGLPVREVRALVKGLLGMAAELHTVNRYNPACCLAGQ